MNKQQNILYTRLRTKAEDLLDKACELDISNNDDKLIEFFNNNGLIAFTCKGKNINDFPCLTLDSDGTFTRVDNKEDLSDLRKNDTYIIIKIHTK